MKAKGKRNLPNVCGQEGITHLPNVCGQEGITHYTLHIHLFGL